ncbi:hypothetical protein Tco_1136190 [Tanacetum coccineum]
MMSDHNNSDLAPQRQDMSVENVSSGLIPQGQKRKFLTTQTLCPKTIVVLQQRRTDSSQQGLEFLFNPLLEEIFTIQHTVMLREGRTTYNPSSRNIDNTDVHSFQPQSHDYRWTRDHPLDKGFFRRIQPCSLKQDEQLATDPKWRRFMVAQPRGFVDPDLPENGIPSEVKLCSGGDEVLFRTTDP